MTSDVRGNKPDPLPLQFNPANHRNPPSSLRRASQVVLSSFPGASTTRDASRSSLSMMVLNDNEGAFCLRLAVRHPTFLQSPHAQLNPTALRSSALCTLTHRLALQCAFRPSRPQRFNLGRPLLCRTTPRISPRTSPRLPRPDAHSFLCVLRNVQAAPHPELSHSRMH